MKKAVAALFMVAMVSAAASGQKSPELNAENANGNGNAKKFYMRGYAKPGGGGAQNLNYHNGGTVIRNANVVLIFWGPSFAVNGSADASYAAQLQAFRNQFGTTGEYNTISQYYGEDPVSGYGNIAMGSLVGQPDWFDTSTPPTNVSDAAVQAEVKKYISTHNSGATDYNAIYEVFLPTTSFSSDGNQGSCGASGGVTLAYCAYHSNYSASGKNVKYSIQPYPSCSGCQVSGWTDAQDQEHFVSHETREAVTDALGNAWFDRRGYEADDKCAWSPSPFIGSGGFGYQYEWSNSNSGCVKTK
ncbi:MAG: hypothetical protein ABI718_12930 [Acidobacteriota bacterium]